jgi:hypothetical protein
MKTLRKILKWFAMDISKPKPKPDHLDEFLKDKFITDYGLKSDPCYHKTMRPQLFIEYDEMQTQLIHAVEWRRSGNQAQELRTLSALWRSVLDRQNEIRKSIEPEPITKSPDE